MTRCHIVAVSPRTGTTLLAECMRACFEIDGFEAHETSVTRLRINHRIYLTKRPADLMSVGPRLSVDPRFHVVCMLRDPRDVIVSRHGGERGRYWVPLRVWQERVPVLRRLMSHERVLVIRYEDLVRDPDGTQRHLQARLPFLVPTRPFSTFHTVAEVSSAAVAALGRVRPFDTASIGNWRRHLPRVAGQVIQHGSISDALVEFGYEPNDQWRSALDGVAPDFEESVRRERTRQRWWRPPRRSRVVLPWISAGLVVAGRTVGLDVG